MDDHVYIRSFFKNVKALTGALLISFLQNVSIWLKRGSDTSPGPIIRPHVIIYSFSTHIYPELLANKVML